MTNKIGINKEEGTLEKISRQLGMEATKVHRGTKGTGITPQKVVKSSKTYTKTPIAKKTYTKQYDTKKKKKDEGLLGSITKYFK
jgi:AraC-like DNA-binding protein